MIQTLSPSGDAQAVSLQYILILRRRTMSTSETAVGNHDSVDEELFALRQYINEYRTALNTEGIWLFLATLGCWSVTNIFLQISAFALALILFEERLSKRRSETRSFSERFEAIEDRISTDLPEGDSQKARLYDLAALRAELSMINSLRSVRTFYLCWFFYGASSLYVFFNFLFIAKSAG
jgi:hypothetical protein